VDQLVEALSKNQEFLDKVSLKLGLLQPRGAASSSATDVGVEGSVEYEASESEDEDEMTDDDEEGGRSHQKGSGKMPPSLQQHHGDRRVESSEDVVMIEGQLVPKTQVPPLTLDRIKAKRGMGWRRLKKSFSRGLVSKATSTHTQTSGGDLQNTLNLPTLVGMVDPVEGASYELPEQVVPVEVILVKDIMADTERLMKEQAQLMGGTVDDVQQEMVQQRDAVESRMEWEKKAVLLVKNSKIAELEEALDEDVPVDTCDEHGNTLLMLSCQQGNKRIAKFLLRRGAKMNMQNLHGNSVLHYCYEYNFEELAEYLKDKGADDSLLNADGLTCYEGLSKKEVDAI